MKTVQKIKKKIDELEKAIPLVSPETELFSLTKLWIDPDFSFKLEEINKKDPDENEWKISIFYLENEFICSFGMLGYEHYLVGVKTDYHFSFREDEPLQHRGENYDCWQETFLEFLLAELEEKGLRPTPAEKLRAIIMQVLKNNERNKKST